jgi:arginine decarboxylase
VCHERGEPLIVDAAWGAHLPFQRTCRRAMDAGADVCVVSVHKMGAGFEHGRELLGDALELVHGLRTDIELIPDVEVLDDELLGHQALHDLDRLQILMDLSATGTSGYQAADWLREHKHVDLGMSDHRRLLATMSFAEDKATGEGYSMR